MCGIAGVVRLDGKSPSEELLDAMQQSIAHRGPDDHGTYVDGTVGFSNRRLAIIDLSERGHMPMLADGHAITFNGEIYNFQNIRGELEAEGITFASDTDTEVALQAYRHWGSDAFLRFNGMFGFAIHDQAEGRVIIARDRFGVKPVYWHRRDDQITFGSEVKAILCDPDVVRGVDRQALRAYFTFQNVLDDHTLFQDVSIIPAGHYLSIDTTTGETELTSYWDYPIGAAPYNGSDDPEAAAAEVRRLFEQAVERQIISDVPVGSFLSGGMDSGSIVAVASRRLPHMVTVTGGFDLSHADGFESGFDERQPAEFMASRFQTGHYEVVMHEGDMRRVIRPLVRHIEDLRVGMCWQNYYVEELASHFVKVCLSGAGGDELFGGYPWRYNIFEGAEDDAAFRDTYFGYWQRLVKVDDHGEFFTPKTMDATDSSRIRESFEEIIDAAAESTPSFIDQAMYFELKTFMHGLLVIGDKISMTHSMETRVPFLDNDLVDYAMAIPSKLKVDPHHEAVAIDENRQGHKELTLRVSNEGKRVLRDAMRGLVPDEIIDRKKQGFSPPDASWYRGTNMEFIRDTVLPDGHLMHAFIRRDAVKMILDEHAAGTHNHRLLIWSILCFAIWCEEFLGDAS